MDQCIEGYKKLRKAIEVWSHNRTTSDTEENKTDYFNTKQKYDDAFYSLNEAINNFNAKLKSAQRFMNHETTQQSMKLIELVDDEFTKLHKIYPKIVHDSFRNYKDLYVTYVFACYFSKLFSRADHNARILLLENSIISKVLEEAAALIDHVTENKPLKSIDFSVFKKMLNCIVPLTDSAINPSNGKIIPPMKTVMSIKFKQTENFDEMRLALIEAKKDYEKRKDAKDREKMLKGLDFCIFFFNIMAEKRGIDGIKVSFFASKN